MTDIILELNLEDQWQFDEESGEYTLTFINESEIDTWFGRLQFDASAKAADFSRITAGVGAFLDSHMRERYLGDIVRAWFKAKEGYAAVRFAPNELAQSVKGDVDAGFRKGISMGIRLLKLELAKEEDGKDRLYRASKWMLLEISSVSVPAVVGVGMRFADGDSSHAELTEMINSANLIAESDTTPGGSTMAPEVTTLEAPVSTTENDVARIVELGRQHDAADLALTAIGEGINENAFLQRLLDRDAPNQVSSLGEAENPAADEHTAAQGQTLVGARADAIDILKLGEEHGYTASASKAVQLGRSLSDFKDEMLKSMIPSDTGTRDKRLEGFLPRQVPPGHGRAEQA